MLEIPKKDLLEFIKKGIKREEEKISKDRYIEDEMLHLGIKIGYEQVRDYIISR